MNSSNFNKIFIFVFGFTLLIIVAQFIIIGWIGTVAVNEVNENNGSVGITIGKFIGEVNKGINDVK